MLLNKRYRAASALLRALSAGAIVSALAGCAPETNELPVPTPLLRQTIVLPTPSSTPKPTPLPLPTIVLERYTIRAGDTLGALASRFDTTVDELMRLNGITNPASLQVGRELKVPMLVTMNAPSDRLVPDSELVYGPSFESFDVSAFVSSQNGYLASYRQNVEGDNLTGAQIVQLAAERYSVGPRVLLTLLEMQSGWVSKPTATQTQITYPYGLIDGTRQGLWWQINWAANQLNAGYYSQIAALKFKDRVRARVAPSANPGTVAIQNFVAQLNSSDTLQSQLAAFSTTYKAYFGDPNAYAVEPLLPRDLTQPSLRLPWSDSVMWYFTGGPHGGWADGSAWGAVDFTPRDILGNCNGSSDWAIAAASGKILRSEHGRVIQSLGNDNFQGKGWVVLYMHMASAGRVKEGAQLNMGERIGHPSCEGGNADSSHLHIARLYNGVWIAPDKIPYVLSGWKIVGGDQEYDGKMSRGNETREACNCRDDSKDGVIADSKQQ